MSYDINMEKDGNRVEVDSHDDGGTYAIGGTTEAWLNVTYNYAWFFYQLIDKDKGIRWLYGKTGAEVQDRLQQAIDQLPEPPHRHDDDKPRQTDPTGKVEVAGTAYGRASGSYWCPTPSNARVPLVRLLAWAKQHPDAVFDGD